MYFNHFSLAEVFRHCSNDEILECVRTHCVDNLLCLVQFLDSFREYAETPVVINSSYRDVAHNKRVKGVSTSQHLLGQAIDFSTPCMPISTTLYFFKEFVSKSALAQFIGQVIIYNNFIHIGLRTQAHKNLVYYDKRDCKNNH